MRDEDLILLNNIIIGFCLFGIISLSCLGLTLASVNRYRLREVYSPGGSNRSIVIIHTSTSIVPQVSLSEIIASPTPIVIIEGATSVYSTPNSTPFSTAQPTYSAINFDNWCIPQNTVSDRGTVIKVVDGDTIEVEIDGRTEIVSYTGIGAPDAGAPYSAEALQENKKLVESKQVLLIRDVSNRDGDGRLIRYVISGAIFVNKEMIERGYANAVSSPPDVNCDASFAEAERLAQATGKGMWGNATPVIVQSPTIAPTPTTQ